MGLSRRHGTQQKGRQLALVHRFTLHRLRLAGTVVIALFAARLFLAGLLRLPRALFLSRLFLPRLFLPRLFWARLLGTRLFHRAGFNGRVGNRFNGGHLVMEFAAGRAAVTMAIVLAAPAATAAALVTAFAAARTMRVLAHFTVHHLAPGQLVAGDLLDGFDVFAIA